MKIKRYIAILLFVSLMLSLCGCKIGSTKYVMKGKETQKDVFFTFNEMECEPSEVLIYLCTYKNLYGSSYDYDLWNGNFDRNELNKYIRDITLAEIERIYVICGLAAEQGIELTEAEIKTVESVAKGYYESLSDDERDYMGATIDSVTTAYSHYALAVKVYESMTDGLEEEVSDDEARVISVQMIYIQDQEKADIVASKLSNTDDFESVAASYSERKSSEFHMARGEYPEAVESAAFGLDEGEISGLIESDDGFYFVKCIDNFDEELTDLNKEKIKQQKQRAQFDAKFAEVIASATFHLNEELWSSMSCITEYELNSSDFFSRYDNR